MLPSVCVHMACWLPANAFVASVVAGMDLEYIQKVEMIHLAYLLAIVYCIVHPIICFVVDTKLRNNVFKSWGTPKVNPVEGQAVQEHLDRNHLAASAIGRRLKSAAQTNGDHFDIMLRTWHQIGSAK